VSEERRKRKRERERKREKNEKMRDGAEETCGFEITCQLESEISSRTNQQLDLSLCARSAYPRRPR